MNTIAIPMSKDGTAHPNSPVFQQGFARHEKNEAFVGTQTILPAPPSDTCFANV